MTPLQVWGRGRNATGRMLITVTADPLTRYSRCWRMEVEPTHREDTQQLIQDHSLKFEDWHQSHLYQRPCEKLAQRHCLTSSPRILLYLIMIWPNTKKCAFTARHQVTNPSRKFVPVSENEGVDGRRFKSPLLLLVMMTTVVWLVSCVCRIMIPLNDYVT